jgi:hypothetical protein
MNRSESVPLGRIVKHLPDHGSWFTPAYQGPGGLFAVCAAGVLDGPTTFQVCHLTKDEAVSYEVSEPFLTQAGALRFARGMAEGTPPTHNERSI